MFQWRWLHAASLRATRTGNMVSTSPPILCAACFRRLQQAATLRVMRTGNVVFNLLCNIEYSIFQWRWLYASTLRKTRTKNMVQHCPKFCAQHFSVDSLHAANIACNIVCSGGGYTLQTLSATKTGNMVPLLVPLLSPPPPHPTEVFELFLIVILT